MVVCYIRLCFLIKDNKSYYFDSFGGQPDKFLLKQIPKPIKYHNYEIQDTISHLCVDKAISDAIYEPSLLRLDRDEKLKQDSKSLNSTLTSSKTIIELPTKNYMLIIDLMILV